MRIGYGGQNGRNYLAIGRTLRDRGVLAPGEATMDGIIRWLRANPEEGRALMRRNKSYVFFRELTGPGPLGALEAPLTPGGSVAADPRFVPRSEEHTSELQSLMRISYAVFCLKKK